MSDDSVHIMVVDDEPGMREGCRRILVAEGYNVATAEDGVVAMELFEKHRDFATMLVDLKMPRMGGIELIERIRKQDQDVALFVITAYATIETAIEATKRGANGYLAKPFTPDELLLHVRNGLEWRALSAETRRLREEREKRLLEVAFERSKINTIVNCMTDGVIVVNRDGQIVLRNAAAARILPSSTEVSLPAPLGAAVACAELRDILTKILRGPSGPLVASREVELEKCPYMVNASPVVEPGGEILGVVAVLRDIAALKKLETAKSLFVSMVAHEVKSHLAAVEGYLNVIRSDLEKEPQRSREMMDRAILRASTLRQMVSELLELRAIETGNFMLTRSPLDVNEIVAETAETCKAKAKEKSIELSVRLGGREKPIKVLADRTAVRTVLSNLIDNATKYTPAGGHVTVRVESDHVYARLSVKDDGIGLAPEDAAKVFDEFFRVRNEQTAHVVGTGLGLSIVKQLVEMHHGKVSVVSALGKGSEFTVSLPLAEQSP